MTILSKEDIKARNHTMMAQQKSGVSIFVELDRWLRQNHARLHGMKDSMVQALALIELNREVPIVSVRLRRAHLEK